MATEEEIQMVHSCVKMPTFLSGQGDVIQTRVRRRLGLTRLEYLNCMPRDVEGVGNRSSSLLCDGIKHSAAASAMEVTLVWESAGPHLGVCPGQPQVCVPGIHVQERSQCRL